MALALVGACSVGVIVGLLAAPSPLPPSASTSAGDATIAVTSTELTDTRQVPLTITPGTKRQLGVSDAGIITSLDCAPGATWTSGTAPVSINGSPRLLLRTASPLWRSLAGGEKGEDVTALQQALTDAGYTAPTGGTFDADTRAALRRLLRTVGITSADGTLNLSDLVPLPSSPVTIESCLLEPGAAVSPGTAIIELGAGLSVAAVTALPTGLLPGERTLTVGATTVPVGADGRVTDAEALSRLAAEPTVQAVATGVAREVSGAFALADPVTVNEIPPSALTAISGAKACVQSEGTAYPVVIVSSSLGATAVQFEDGVTPPTSLSLNPDAALPCG